MSAIRTIDLLAKLPDDAPRAAGFAQRTARAMTHNPHPLPGERTATIGSARFTFDDTTGRWCLDMLFKMRHRTGKYRNHRLTLSAGGRGIEPAAKLDGRDFDVYGALHPRVNKIPVSQYPSVLAKRIVSAAETNAVRIGK